MRLDTEVLIAAVARYGQRHGRGAWAGLGRASGLSPVTIGKIARGEVEPTLDSWDKLHRAAPEEIVSPRFDPREEARPAEGNEAAPTQPRLIPLIAYVSAGEGFGWTDCQLEPGQALDWMPAPPDGPVHPNMYCVRVRGDSMLPILKDGDVLYVHPEKEVINHDLVVFRDQDAAFVKRVSFSGPMVILKSLNPAYPEVVRSRSEALVLQRVVWIKP